MVLFRLFLSLVLVCAFSLPVFASELTVSAAASLTNAFTAMKALFEQEQPGVTVRLNFAASNPLLKQMQEGAPVDVFASADQATMDAAQASKLVDASTRRNFARNDLVLIVPKGAKKPSALRDLRSFSKIAIGNPASVPAGRYAKAALESAKEWNALLPHFIQGNSVRQVLEYVARGEVDAGFVYRTDALQRAQEVDLVLTLQGHEPVTYPIAVATGGSNRVMAKRFIDVVFSQKGMDILAKYGFSRP